MTLLPSGKWFLAQHPLHGVVHGAVGSHVHRPVDHEIDGSWLPTRRSMSLILSKAPRGGCPALPCSAYGLLAAALIASLGVFSGGFDAAVAHAQPAAAEVEGLPEVPPCPDGTPEELIAFVQQLQQPQGRPSSREEMMNYFGKVAEVSLEAADKILAQAQDDETAVAGSRMKLESLMMLSQLGNETAEQQLMAFAETLVDGPSPELATEARRIGLLMSARRVMNTGGQGAEQLLTDIGQMLEADPDDAQTAQLAMQVAGAFENMPGGETLAKQAYGMLATMFAKSSDERIQAMGKNFEGVMRRLDLPGNPIEISGTLLDGKAFDQRSLEGQVVLVDFWATWCGPCIAELPNVLEQYEKYHDRGFEVIGISLDEDREALVDFIKEREIPWPILFEEPQGSGWNHPMATKYGISGIPTVILVGRDGRVVSMDVRGEKLGEALDKLFAN
jgi:thiol-disulfide isomerase/thioredoxin